MESIVLEHSTAQLDLEIPLVSSKSESNRALIINALANFEGQLSNLAEARDTQTMMALLASSEPEADVLDAGTTMRFLTAYFSLKNEKKVMTGTPRMKERPIGILVDSLRKIGVSINYLGVEGYPPFKIEGFVKQISNELEIAGNVSSQYVSALLMIAPLLPNGLKISLIGEVGSIPYIKMTIKQMEAFGVNVVENWEAQTLEVKPQTYKATSYKVESDWSGASYWYSVIALSDNPNSRIKLLGLKKDSLQGDSRVASIMKEFGVASTFDSEGVLLTKTSVSNNVLIDFKDCPDLAQTIAVVGVAKNINCTFTGIESLKIKETDRVLALQNELKKIGGDLVEVKENEEYKVINSDFFADNTEIASSIETYDDHRMAMAFAPLCMKAKITIDEPGVVVKSYPSFWDHMSLVTEVK